MNATSSQINKTMIEKLNSRKYWKYTKKIFDEKLDLHSSSYELLGNELTNILKASQNPIEKIIINKFNNDKSRDNARKPIAGNNYQALIAYFLALAYIEDESSEIAVAIKPKSHPIIKEYAELKMGSVIQKPDLDILLYGMKENSPIVVLSCKTSLRERAGQTAKWKILLDLANSNCKCDDCPKNLYNINYEMKRTIYTGLITADLYDEIGQPQQQGLFSFFDFVYVSKPTTEKFGIARSLELIFRDLKKIYK